jgi:16S rRNA (uracil1498-N3)-methyltransferase
MNLPFFYTEGINGKDGIITLNEDSSRHIIQVLRMKAGERVRLTDGAGTSATCIIETEHKKATTVRILHSEVTERPSAKRTIAVSLLKNAARFEWFLEKATELGISAIVPLLCERTEKQHFRTERMKNILVSAMLQSQQTWLPQLGEPIPFQRFINADEHRQKFIAHCLEGDKRQLAAEIKSGQQVIVLIGPEGDFTASEIDDAISKSYVPVSLGNTRLRTETAALAAAVIVQFSSVV